MRSVGLVGSFVIFLGCVEQRPQPEVSDDETYDAAVSDASAPDAARTLAKPTHHFRDVTTEAGVGLARSFEYDYYVTGQAWGDANGDGWPDLYLTNSTGPNGLFLNRGDGTFEASADDELSLPNHKSGGAVFVDYDNDGDLDLYVLNLGPNVLFRNRGDGTFVDVTEAAGVGDPGKGETASWGDYDNDGYLDLYVANWLCPECGNPEDVVYDQDRFYRNRGDGTFEDVGHLLGLRYLRGAGFVASFVDYDDDNDLDIYLINDKGYAGAPPDFGPMNRNVLWRNDGAMSTGWKFTEVAVEAGADARVDGMGLAIGDPDLDGDLDFFFSNTLPPVFLRNIDGTRFVDETERVGLYADNTSWGTVFFDHDNDGDEDLYLAIGSNFGANDTNLFFDNRGDGTFRNASDESGADDPGYTIGVASADFDRDGLVDLVIGNWDHRYVLLKNTGKEAADHHYLRVRLIGSGPINADAIGSRVYVESADGARQLREIKCGSSLGSGNELVAHFGLGTATEVASVEVRWPNGERTTFDDIEVDRELLVRYGD